MPPMVTTTEYAPGLSPGTTRFACAHPTVPGVSPKNGMGASHPPMVALADRVAFDSVVLEAGAPVAAGLSSGPMPVSVTVMTEPDLAGESARFYVLSWFIATAS